MTELRWGGATDVGRVREKNDDQYLLASPLFAVADGMGGARGGDVASITAVEALKAAFDGKTSADDLVEAVKAANRAVYEKAGSRQLRGMGTTITALALLPGAEDDEGGKAEEFAVVNVGDSRAYMLRDGELQQLTDDHNVPGELLRRGELTAEQAAVHPQRNLVTRVLGIEDEVEVDVWQLLPYAGDRFLLASDGLFGEISDDDVATVLRTESDPDAAARKLVDMARDAGGHDNITVVIVDVVDDGGRAEAASKALAGTRGKRKGKSEPEDAQSTEKVPVVAPAPGDDVLPDAENETAPPPKRRSAARILALFVVGILIGGAAAAGVIWYGQSAWFLDTVDDQVVIVQGRPGGFLWVEPETVETTELELSELPPDERDVVRSDTTFASLGEARDQVDRLERRAEAYREEREPPPTTTTTAPPPPSTAPAPPPPAPPAGQ